MGKKILLFLLVFILAVNISYAADIKTYSAEFDLVGNKAVVEIELVFDNPVTDVFEFELPSDFSALSVYIDDELVLIDVEDTLKIQTSETSNIRFNYVTSEFTDKTNFLMNMHLDFDADDLVIKLVLPEGASLKKPMKEGDLTSGSIFPKPSKATTDGRSLIFYWLEQDVEKGDEISIFTQIETKSNPTALIVLLVAVVLISVGLFVLKKNPIKKTVLKIESRVEKHLKPEEEQIINIIKKKEGSCEQGTLRVVTGFSKAHLSRLLKELEDRKVIFKEKRGKKNLVFLKR